MPILGKLLVWLGANTTELKEALGQVERRLKKVGGEMQKAGAAMSKSITAPLLGIGAVAGKTFATFDKAMATSTSIMGDLSATMRQDLAQAARDMSEEVTFSASELARAYYHFASAGMDATQSIKALPVVARFATAGQMDLEKATMILTDAQFALGMSSKDAAINQQQLIRVSDALVTADNMAKGTVEDFANALSNQAGAALRMVGKDLEEGIAVLAAFAQQGIKGSDAGTKLYIVLRDLQRAALKNEEEFKKQGIAVYDNAGQMRHMADIIADMEKAFANLTPEQRRAEIEMLGFQDRSVAATIMLMGMSSAIREYDTRVRDAAVSTESIANKQLANLHDRFLILRNIATNVAITIGEKLVPVFDSLIAITRQVIQTFRGWAELIDLSNWFELAAVKVAVFIGVLGPLMWALGGLIRNLGFCAGYFKHLVAVIAWVAANPTTVAIAALAALGAAELGNALSAQKASESTKTYASELERLTAAAEKAKDTEESLGEALTKTKTHVEGLLKARAALLSVMQKLQATSDDDPLRSLAGLAAGKQELEKLNAEIGTTYKLMDILRANKWAAEQASRTAQLAVAEEEYATSLKLIEEKYAVEKNDLNKLNSLCQVRQTHFEKMIRLGADKTKAKAFLDETLALEKQRGVFEDLAEEQSAATRAEKEFADAIGAAERMLCLTGDETEYLNELLKVKEARLKKVVELEGDTSAAYNLADEIEALKKSIELLKEKTDAQEASKQIAEEQANLNTLYEAQGNELEYVTGLIALEQKQLENLIEAGAKAGDAEVQGLVRSIAAHQEREAVLQKNLQLTEAATSWNEEYAKSLDAVEARYAIEGDDLERVNGILALKKQAYDKLIEQGGGVSEEELSNLVVEINLFEEAKNLLEKQKKAKDDAASSSEAFARALEGAALKQRWFKDEVETAEEKLGIYKSRLQELIEQGVRAPQQLDPLVAKIKELEAYLESPKVLILKVDEEAARSFRSWFEEMQLTVADLYNGAMEVFDGIASGFGNAMAQCIVYGQSWRDAFGDFGKQILATMVSLFAQLLIEQLFYWLASLLTLKAETGAKLASFYATGSAAAAASVFETVPYPANLILAPIAAAAALGIMQGAASAGMGMGKAGSSAIAMAEGGILTQPTLIWGGERGPEAIIPIEKLGKFLPSGDTTVIFEMDHRPFAKALIPRLPGVIRRRIGR